MKKFIFISALIFLTISGFSQRPWEFSIVLDSIPGGDSVLYPANSLRITDVSGFGWSATIYSSDVDTNFVVSFGGSNMQTNTTTHVYAFESFESDVLPYTFNPDSLQVITNSDTTIQKTFHSGRNAYGFKVPQVHINNADTATGTIYGRVNFFKF